jgi:predicted Zn-dependent protease
MALGAWQVPGPAHAQSQSPGQNPGQSPVRLPSLGESASEDLSVGAERRLGEQIMREARRDPDLLDDPVLQEYLLSIFNPLVNAARKTGNIDAEIDRAFAWEAFLVRDRSVNAFALPGGYVGVHLGLIAITTSGDQLASVLAHEITHVTQRHIARSIAPQQRASIVAIAALILGLIAASRSNNPDVANAAIYGGQGAAIQSQLNYSRDAEREADRIGFALLAPAGYSASGMASMFEKLDQASRLNDNGGFPYLRSHPLTTDRISEARSRTLFAPGAPAVPTLQHALMQMRARVLMADGVQGLQRISGSSASPARNDRIAALYGGALAASLQNDHARAETQATQALQLALATTTGEAVKVAAKVAAKEAAKEASKDLSAERSLRLLLAQVRLARGDAAGSLQALDELPSLKAPVTPSLSPTLTPTTPTASATGTPNTAPNSATNTPSAIAATGTGTGTSTSTSTSTSTGTSTSTSIDISDRPPMLLRAQALLAQRRGNPATSNAANTGPLRASTEALQTWLAEQPHDAAAWELAAATSDALGLKLRSLRAGAEARYVLGDLPGAIDRLRAAQQVSRTAAGQDFIEASVIDARLRQIVALRRQLQLEARGDSRDDRNQRTGEEQ